MISLVSLIFLVIMGNGTNASDDDITSKDIVTWTISLISAFAAMGGLLYVAKKFNEDANAGFIQSLVSIDAELLKIETDPNRIAAANSPNRIIWEKTYLNAVGKIAYLITRKKYPNAFGNYFERNFKWAQALIDLDPSRPNIYKEIVQLCKDKKWRAEMLG